MSEPDFMLTIIGIIAGWIICGALAYARLFAYLHGSHGGGLMTPDQAAERRHQDWLESIAYGICGPIGLVAAVVYAYGYGQGLKWR